MPNAKTGARVRSLVPSLTVSALSFASSVAGGVTVAVSVAGTVPSVPPRPVTVRVKISPVPAGSAGMVTTGVALVASSNVTVTPLAGSVSAQP